jgi:uncharacterized protein YutE (UPF0331/DUF86 family)
MADKEIVLAKLQSVRHCLDRIESKKPFSDEELEKNYDLQDILSVNLERAVQTMVDIGLHILARDFDERPGDMGSVFEALAEKKILAGPLAARLKKSVGFRNIAVHEYRKIDWKIVSAIVHNGLDDFNRYTRSILDYMA